MWFLGVSSFTMANIVNATTKLDIVNTCVTPYADSALHLL